ncbi:WSC-domain-containing protein [Lophium mytilinum]|uniref:WSC-domain-containing protein n=1 Tax=Lophium mytilinum TaxID=390894 RepID=A0A6A6QS18_9PEZI|nr:WSC-domain-containing protein [Lophium mytilinum]
MSIKTLSSAFALAALLSSATAHTTLQRRTQTPLPPCSYPFTDFVSSGCYVDSVSSRTLPFMAPIEFNNATIEICTAACKGNGYRYAGLEYYGQCFCGSSVIGTAAPETDCNLPCNGDSGEICGGQDRLSIYQDPTFPEADNIAVSSDYMSLGCYTEASAGRALAYSQINEGANLDGTKMTTQLCLNACGARGFPFAGTEFGGECYCGVVLGNGTVPAPTSDCDKTCNGDSTQTCGGAQRLSLYVATDLESTEPCEAPAVSSSSAAASSTVSSSTSCSSTVSSTTVSSTSSVFSSSTLSTQTTSCPIPTNTYVPPSAPTTKTTTTGATAAPSASCLCATPTAWAGKKAVGNYQLPCVGCNDNKTQRQSYPWKLFNNQNFGRCPSYGKGKQVNACQDACTTQYNWCLSYANSCKNSRSAPESFTSANGKCRQQYADCYKANNNVKDDGRCTVTSSPKPVPQQSDQWFNWCSSWLKQWF